MSDVEKIFDDRRKCVVGRCNAIDCRWNKNNNCMKPSITIGKRGECKDYEGGRWQEELKE